MIEPESYARILEIIAKGVQCDGVLNQEELAVLKETLLQDRVVDAREASLLFDIQKHLKANEQADETFYNLFVHGVTSYLINSDDAPGTLSAQQFAWLQERISEDHLYTELESDLLRNLVVEAETLPPNFHEWLRHLEIHLKDFEGDLDELEYEQRTSFMAELKALIAKHFPGED